MSQAIAKAMSQAIGVGEELRRMSDEASLEAQVVSQAVQAGLSSQLDAADAVSVDVRTDLLKAVQGQVDSVSVSGQGVVMQDVRVQELSVQTDRIAVNPLQALFGNFQLAQPVDATARMVFSEADLNQTMNSELVASRIPPLRLQVGSEPIELVLQFPVALTLPAVDRVSLAAAAQIRKPSGTRVVRFAATLMLTQGGLPIVLESFQCDPGQGIPLDLAVALMQQFQALLRLPALEIAGMRLQIQRVEIVPGQLTIASVAQLQDLPSL